MAFPIPSPGMLRSLALVFALASVPAFAGLAEGLEFLQRGSYGNAYRELKEAAEAGDVVAARTLGWMLERGVSVRGGRTFEARPEEAARWYRRAAEAGDAHSASMLGVLHTSGRGVPRDFAQARLWFERSGMLRGETSFTQYPEADRLEMIAWTSAVAVAVRREIRYPRAALVRNSWGRVVLGFDAGTNTVSVVGTDGAIQILVSAAESAGRAALEVAPPPPAAARHGIRIEEQIDFTIDGR